MYYGTKRRVFISFYKGNTTEVNNFIGHWANQERVFTPYVLGAGDNDDFINSTNTDYVMSQIRQRYLKDSTVTIVLLGSCTHSRRYVDWEVKSSLRKSSDGQPNGLLGVLLPSAGNSVHLPERFKQNWSKDGGGYASYRGYPTSAQELGGWIDDAFSARTARTHLIQNSQAMWTNNRKCQVCGVTH